MSIVKNIKLSQVVFDESLYPRKEHDPVTVQKYTSCLDEIEQSEKFITVSHDFRLLDGKHRWLAYRTVYESEPDKEIPVYIDDTVGESQLFKVAVRLNSQHGYQLSQADKKECAITMYRMKFTPETIQQTLSVSKRTVANWLEAPMRDEREKTNQVIFDTFMACHSQEELLRLLEWLEQQ